MTKLEYLIDAETKAAHLFMEVEQRGLIQPGKTEKTLNTEIFELAESLFGIRKYWHKRIVRAGRNTLLPYRANPENLTLQEDDILFFDFGPVFEQWEADFGRTYVIGQDARKLKLMQDVEAAWQEGRAYYLANREQISGAEFYQYTTDLAQNYGWEYANEHAGHLIGDFPHEKILGEERINYIHPENKEPMSNLDQLGDERFWIYEVHFVDKTLEIGAFFEQLIYE